jgi:hypothetical protein
MYDITETRLFYRLIYTSRSLFEKKKRNYVIYDKHD